MNGDPLDILMHHSAWATRTLLERCRPLTSEQFHRRFEIGLGSLHDSMLHIIGAMRRWADRIEIRELRPRLETTGVPPTSIDDMLALLDAASGELISIARRATVEGTLGEVIEVRFTSDGPTHRLTRAATLVHVGTHTSYHHAQVMNMLRHLGVSPLPDVDVCDWQAVADKSV